MKNPEKRGKGVAKMNAAARVAAYRAGKGGSDKAYRPNPRRSLSNGTSWRQRPS